MSLKKKVVIFFSALNGVQCPAYGPNAARIKILTGPWPHVFIGQDEIMCCFEYDVGKNR